MRTIKIFDPIWNSDGFTSGFGVKDMDRELSLAKGEDVHVLINSPGGDVYEGLGIYSLLKKYEGEVTTEIIGIGASMASVIFLAGDKRVMGEAGFLMIHEAWGYTVGKSEDHKNTAEELDQINAQILSIYQKVTGMDKDELKERMSKDTYFGPEEMLALGFATEIKEGARMVAYKDPFNQIAKGEIMANKNEAPDELEKKVAELETKLTALQEENTALKAQASAEAIQAKIDEGIKAEQDRITAIQNFAMHEKQASLVAKLIAEKTPVIEAKLALAENFKAEGSAWIASNPVAILEGQAPSASKPEGEPAPDNESIHKEIKTLKAQGKFNEANELFNKHFKEIK